MSEYETPYHLLGLISMTRALWVFLVAQLALQVFAIALCFVRGTTPNTSVRLVRGNTVALILSVVVSVVTVLAGFRESFAAKGPDREKAAQLASGLLTVINGFLMAILFTAVAGALLWVQYKRASAVQQAVAAAGRTSS